ncbi:hypothetical protein BKA62DRAFT_721566 [Auriculariales sp. MPI-PUGE-AT-0066]|nr:hypothetical protein BKA62DRAFT_721566 [Auriculariales sp. MPI-PUGE-AT-0066]
MSARHLPPELLCFIIELAANDRRDIDLAWTSQLALVHRTYLRMVRAFIYELYVVARRVRMQDPADQCPSADPSIREFIVMMKDETDARRAHIKCLVFSLHPNQLQLADLEGCRWNIDTVVCPSEGEYDDEVRYPPLALHIRRFVSVIFIDDDGDKGISNVVVSYDVELAALTSMTVPDALFTHIPDPSADGLLKSLSHLLRIQVEPRFTVIFSPGATAVADATANVASRAEMVRAIRTMDEQDQSSAVERVRWLNVEWRWDPTLHPERYRKLLCGGGRWDEGEPLLH